MKTILYIIFLSSMMPGFGIIVTGSRRVTNYPGEGVGVRGGGEDFKQVHEIAGIEVLR